MNKKLFIIAPMVIIFIVLIFTFNNYRDKNQLPVVAIANYGPHASLDASINGLKDQMSQEGFIENKTIRYEIMDVGFNSTLIPQMIASLVQHKPKVLVVMTTPVAQFAKGKVHDIPIVYNVVTDPIEAGLIKFKYKPDGNMTGSSEKQDLYAFLEFAKTILPNATKVGLLYSISESNDIALVNMMREATSAVGMSVVAIPIEQARDVSIRVQEFRNKVDFIYVGCSGPIQPTLPTIAAAGQKMNIPIFNSDGQAVQDGIVLASFGVDFESIGRNAGKLVISLLNGKDISDLPPVYPKTTDHYGLINKKIASSFNITVPKNIAENIEIVR